MKEIPALLPPPLTKRRTDGTLYQRPPEVEAALAKVLELSRAQVITALSIRERQDPRYIPSECLVHLLRHTRWDRREPYFEHLYKALMDRIYRAVPCIGHRIDGRIGVDLSHSRVREQVRDIFQEALLRDQAEPGHRLDFFEARFAAGIAKLRATAKKKIWREAGRQESLEPVNESGDLSLEVERAAGSLDTPAAEIWDDPRYRSRLEAAIDALPPEQSRIIGMLRAGIPMDSTELDAVTIRKILNCAEKTVRNRRDAAIRALRRMLGLEDQR